MIGKKLCTGVLAAALTMATPLTAFCQWYDDNPLIAHALGEADGKIETNSKEAFIASWGNGFRVVEADFTYTRDGVLVVRHDFEVDGSYYRLEQAAAEPLVMNQQAYMDSKIVYEQTPMRAVELIGLMDEYPEMYLVTDTKDTDQATVQRQFRDLKQIAEAMGKPELLKRVVPQIYSREMYTWVNEIYPFDEWIYTLYLDAAPDYAQIGDFCAANGIETVTMERERVTKAVVDLLHEKGVRVYAHTINRYLQLKELLEMGVDGVYTDRIKPYELPWVGLTQGRSIEKKPFTLSDSTVTLDTLQIFNQTYVPLRQLAGVGRGFAAQYDAAARILRLTSGRSFTSLGNELLLDNSGRLQMENASFALQYDGKAVSVRLVLVDGEVFAPLEEMVQLMGLGG